MKVRPHRTFILTLMSIMVNNMTISAKGDLLTSPACLLMPILPVAAEQGL